MKTFKQFLAEKESAYYDLEDFPHDLAMDIIKKFGIEILVSKDNKDMKHIIFADKVDKDLFVQVLETSILNISNMPRKAANEIIKDNDLEVVNSKDNSEWICFSDKATKNAFLQINKEVNGKKYKFDKKWL